MRVKELYRVDVVMTSSKKKRADGGIEDMFRSYTTQKLLTLLPDILNDGVL
jgi:hypothetical protein